MTVEILKAGKVVSKSKNLRGVRDYARRFHVVRVETWPTGDGGGVMRVTYADGAQCSTQFASHVCLVQWIADRRSWVGAEIVQG